MVSTTIMQAFCVFEFNYKFSLPFWPSLEYADFPVVT